MDIINKLSEQDQKSINLLIKKAKDLESDSEIDQKWCQTLEEEQQDPQN
jgi:hypothetical protein